MAEVIPRSISSMLHRPGSEWYELVIRAQLKWPERSGVPHGHARRWDWGITVRSLFEATQRHERLMRFARGMTPEQYEAAWSDPSPEAAQLRKVMR